MFCADSKNKGVCGFEEQDWKEIRTEKHIRQNTGCGIDGYCVGCGIVCGSADGNEQQLLRSDTAVAGKAGL